MRKELKTLWIAVAVLAVLQILGGIAYTAYTASEDSRYTYVDCTVISVNTHDGEDGALIVDGIIVSYVDENGNTVIAEMEDFPSSFSEGSLIGGRFSDDPKKISTARTDWFTPVFLIILGLFYALIDAVALIFRKKAGLYALVDATDETSADVEDEIGDEDSNENENFDNSDEN